MSTVDVSATRGGRIGLAVIRNGFLPLLLLVELIGFGLATPQFLTASNLADVVVNSSDLALVALGMTLVILLGGIDVSVGAMLGVIVWVAAFLSGQNVPALLIVVVCVASGMVLGGLNGVIVSFGRVSPIIVTLGTSAIFSTVLFLLWNSHDLYAGPVLSFLGPERIGGFPVVAIVVLAWYAVVSYVLRARPWGRRLYAVGNDAAGARLLGVPVKWVTLRAYLLLGAIVGFAALIYLGRVGDVQANSGSEETMLVIAAVVVGGTSILGGEGGALRTLGGVLFIALLQNGVALVGVPPLWDGVLVGIALILAVGVDLAVRTLTREQRGEQP